MSRRAMLGTALGAAAGAVGASLLQPRATSAADGNNVLAGNTTLAEHSTEVRYDGSGGFSGMVLLGNDSTFAPTGADYPAACGGWAGAGGSAGAGGLKHGVYGFTANGSGNGVVGAMARYDSGTGGAGVYGISSSSAGAGVRAGNTGGGNALKVEGPASFSRSGRANVAAGKSYVDVTVGTLGTSANVLATLQILRSGVWVAACRRNYPSSGKVRIYLNKVASSTISTAVAWFVFG